MLDSSCAFGLHLHLLNKHILHITLPPIFLISSILQKCWLSLSHPLFLKSYSYWFFCNSLITSKLFLNTVISDRMPIICRFFNFSMISESWLSSTPTAPKRKDIYWLLNAPSSIPIRYTVKFSLYNFLMEWMIWSLSCWLISMNLLWFQTYLALSNLSKEYLWK